MPAPRSALMSRDPGKLAAPAREGGANPSRPDAVASVVTAADKDIAEPDVVIYHASCPAPEAIVSMRTINVWSMIGAAGVMISGYETASQHSGVLVLHLTVPPLKSDSAYDILCSTAGSSACGIAPMGI